jgi:4-hydroxybenzoate polyprenyltransferase
LTSLRPKQWVKNGFVFAALIFSKNLLRPKMLLITIVAFGIFCLLSGGVYLLNDLLDMEKDKLHPKKSNRPLASGRLSPKIAKIAAGLILTVSLMSAFLIVNIPFGGIALCYLAIQVAYSALIKEVVILDVFSIAAGYFLRVAAGAVAIGVPISSWLLICSIFISLFLVLGKRRNEFTLWGENAGNHREVLGKYNILVLDQMVGVATAGTAISYSLYTQSHETVIRFGTEKLWYTIPIVLYGIFRYLYLVYKKNMGESPESAIFEDKSLLACIFLYVIAVGAIVYL